MQPASIIQVSDFSENIADSQDYIYSTGQKMDRWPKKIGNLERPKPQSSRQSRISSWSFLILARNVLTGRKSMIGLIMNAVVSCLLIRKHLPTWLRVSSRWHLLVEQYVFVCIESLSSLFHNPQRTGSRADVRFVEMESMTRSIPYILST